MTGKQSVIKKQYSDIFNEVFLTEYCNFRAYFFVLYATHLSLESHGTLFEVLKHLTVFKSLFTSSLGDLPIIAAMTFPKNSYFILKELLHTNNGVDFFQPKFSSPQNKRKS